MSSAFGERDLTDGVRILAADLGATRARFATFLARGGKLEKIRKRVWPTAEHDGIRPLLEAYIADEQRAPDRACLALAGPVENGAARLTNLGWHVDRTEAADVVGVPSLRLVNDFVAAAHGILELQGNDTAVLQAGEARPGAPIAILGAGTGLGVAHVDCGSRPGRVISSEGGHADFAPSDDVEWGLARFLAVRYGHASRERALGARTRRHLSLLGGRRTR